MSPSGDQLHLQQGKTAADCQRFVAGLDLLAAGRGAFTHPHQTLSRVLGQVSAQGGLLRPGPSEGHAKVFLSDCPLPDQTGKQLLGLRVLGNQHQTAGTGVQPVTQGRRRAFARLPTVLLMQIQHGPVNQGIRLGVVDDRQPGRLVHQQNVIVLINRLCSKAGAQKRRTFRLHRSQLVVRQEQANLVTGLHPSGERLFFSVQLDLVFPQRLVQFAEGQDRELLGEVFVQPYRGKTFHGNDLHERASRSLHRPSSRYSRCASSISRVTISHPAS